jgi:hypothetical protein
MIMTIVPSGYPIGYEDERRGRETSAFQLL